MRGFKQVVKTLFGILGIEVSGYPTFSGFVWRGFWFRPRRPHRSGSLKPFNAYAAFLVLKDSQFHTVLDIGSGGGDAAAAFAAIGKHVTCVDLGTSVYFQEGAQRHDRSRIRVLRGNFSEMEIDGKFDLIWAAHILEHQKNVGQFLEKVARHCHPSSTVCITVPVSDYRLVGGHLTLWTPGLLLYNLVINGFDCSNARLIEDGREFSVICGFRPAVLPPLDYDSGDIDRLKQYFPPGFFEGRDMTAKW